MTLSISAQHDKTFTMTVKKFVDRCKFLIKPITEELPTGVMSNTNFTQVKQTKILNFKHSGELYRI